MNVTHDESAARMRRTPEEIREQIRDFEKVVKLAEEYGTPDVASQLGLESIRLHAESLSQALRVAEISERTRTAMRLEVHQAAMNELETMIETLNLGEVHKQELRSRWLKQLSQMDLNARRMHKWNSLLHFTMIAGVLALRRWSGSNRVRAEPAARISPGSWVLWSRSVRSLRAITASGNVSSTLVGTLNCSRPKGCISCNSMVPMNPPGTTRKAILCLWTESSESFSMTLKRISHPQFRLRNHERKGSEEKNKPPRKHQRRYDSTHLGFQSSCRSRQIQTDIASNARLTPHWSVLALR